MKEKIAETIDIPSEITCEINEKNLIFKKGPSIISREIKSPSIIIEKDGAKIRISSEKATKNQYKIIKSLIAHIKNIFLGLEEKF